MKILIINQFADNIGDRAVLHILVQLIRETCSDSDITVSTTRPEAWQKTALPGSESDKKVKFVPWSGPRQMSIIPRRVTSAISHRWVYPSIVDSILSDDGVKASAKFFLNETFLTALEETDIVISTGGHHYTNWFATSGVSVLFQDLALAILYKKPTYLWSQTVGPLLFSNERNQQFVVKTLESCRAIYVRDQVSRKAVKEVGMSSDGLVDTLESVFALKVPNIKQPSLRPKRVGISIYTGPVRKTMDFDKYIQDLAKYVQFVVIGGYEVLFFPMQIFGQRGDDRPMIREIVDAAGCGDMVRILDKDLPTDQHAQEVAQCQVFVAHKTHAVVFSLTTGTPTIAIAYHPKAAHFMALYDQASQCIEEDKLSFEWLKKSHLDCEKESEEFHRRQLEITKEFQQRIYEDFGNILNADFN